MENNIISLQEMSENTWQAKYGGNYGIYTIKINLDHNQKMCNFYCSCPSDYYPCKHIPVIEKKVYERLKTEVFVPKEMEISLKETLENASKEELIDFIEKQAKYNPQLTNAFLFEYSKNTYFNGENKYNSILRNALKNIEFDLDDLYINDDHFDIDILYNWQNKTREFLNRNEYQEAVEISKAMIEEYAGWVKEKDQDVLEYADFDYFEYPFEILKEVKASGGIDSKELFCYCRTEMIKDKYKNTDILFSFNDLLRDVAELENEHEFMQVQDELLAQIPDKISYNAEKFLKSKIDFYYKYNQSEKVEKVLIDHIDIENFRKELVKKKNGE